MAPRTPEKMDEFILQIAYDLAQQKRTGKNGPEGGKFFDFIDAMTTHGPIALENEKKRQKELGENDLPKRRKDERSESRGQLLQHMGNYQSMLFKLEKLGDSLHERKFDSTKKMLPTLRKEMLDFYNDYERFKGRMPDMIQNDAVLWKFDQLFTDGACPVGKAFRDKLNGVDVELPREEKALGPEEGPENLPLYGPMTREEDLQAKREAGEAYGEEILASEPFKINDQIIETQRETHQLNTGRRYTTRFAAGMNSYDSILGKCQTDLKKDGKDVNELLATALAAARLRKQGEPFSSKMLKEEAKQIKASAGFAAMTKNKDFVTDTIDKPEKIDRALGLYERENQVANRKAPAPQSYSEYIRLHSWPNVPRGKEKEYLSKLIAASRLKEHNTPFDKDTIRKDAEAIRKQVAYNEMVEEQTATETPEARTRRWLHEDEVISADVSLQHIRQQRLEKNNEEKDHTKKSWAGYRRMHTGENVPANAGREDKRLYLAKAMVAIRGMVDDKPFSLKAARKAAASLMKNPHFLSVTQDPEKVSKVLNEGRVVDMFEEMANARRKALYQKQELQQKKDPILESSVGESGLETSQQNPGPSAEHKEGPKSIGIGFEV